MGEVMLPAHAWMTHKLGTPWIFPNTVSTSPVKSQSDPDLDIVRQFVAPDGKTVSAVVLSPRGGGVYEAPQMASQGAPSTPDLYFPWVMGQGDRHWRSQNSDSERYLQLRGPGHVARFRLQRRPVLGVQSALDDRQLGRQLSGRTISLLPLQNLLSDLEIDFQGSPLNFNNSCTRESLSNSRRDCVWENFTIDYPWIQMAALGTIIADPNGSGHHAVSIDTTYPVTATSPNFTINSFPQIHAINTWDQGPGAGIGKFAPSGWIEQSEQRSLF